MDTPTQLLQVVRQTLPGVEHFIQETLAFESLSDSARIEWAVLIQHLTKLQHNRTTLEECIAQLQTPANEQSTPVQVASTAAAVFDSSSLPEIGTNEVTDHSSSTVVSSAGVEQAQNLEIILNEEKSETINLEINNVTGSTIDPEQTFGNLTLLNPLCTDSELSTNTESFLEQYTMDSQRRFCCSICPKRFTRKQHLNQHLIVHSGDKPYHCSFCVRKFIYPCLLRDHLKLHLNPPHCCTQCPQKFIHKKEFLRHMETHIFGKQFACPNCSKIYRTRKVLKTHMKKCHVSDELLNSVGANTKILHYPQLQKMEPLLTEDL